MRTYYPPKKTRLLYGLGYLVVFCGLLMGLNLLHLISEGTLNGLIWAAVTFQVVQLRPYNTYIDPGKVAVKTLVPEDEREQEIIYKAGYRAYTYTSVLSFAYLAFLLTSRSVFVTLHQADTYVLLAICSGGSLINYIYPRWLGVDDVTIK